MVETEKESMRNTTKDGGLNSLTDARTVNNDDHEDVAELATSSSAAAHQKQVEIGSAKASDATVARKRNNESAQNVASIAKESEVLNQEIA